MVDTDQYMGPLKNEINSYRHLWQKNFLLIEVFVAKKYMHFFHRSVHFLDHSRAKGIFKKTEKI